MAVCPATKFLSMFLLLTLLVCAPAAVSQAYTITDLGVLPGQTTSAAVGINKSGQIAGYSGSRSFIYSNGTMTDLGMPPGANLIQASGINNLGQIVGFYVPTTSSIQTPLLGFIWTNGNISDPFNESQIGAGDNLFRGIQPVAINDSGEVVANYRQGSYNVTTTFNHGFLWTGPNQPIVSLGGDDATSINNSSQALFLKHPYYTESYVWTSSTVTGLGDLPNGTGSTAHAINDNGRVVGEVGLSNYNSHAFSWAAGTFSDLGTLGGANSAARALNGVGQIVGDSDQTPATATTTNRHAFVSANGRMTDLNSVVADAPGWEMQSAVGINDSGQIVGNGTYLGNQHGFLLTPITHITLSPTQGGNAGSVTLSIFFPGAAPTSVELVCPGSSPIIGTSLATLGPGAVQATFDLTGVQPGSCSLLFNEPDGTTLTTPSAFSVLLGGAANLWVDIIGFSNLRAGQPQQYFLLLGNSGIVDYPSGATANVSFPSFLNYAAPDGPIAGTLYQVDTTSIAFYQSYSPLPAGATLIIPFTLSAPTAATYAHQPFQITAW